MKKFEHELEVLKRRVVEMGEVTESMIGLSLKALVDRDSEIIKEVLAAEEKLDHFQVENDNEAVRLITLYSPIARDLRFLLMVARINTELERIGDQCVNNCEYVELLLSEPPLKPLIDLPRMAEISRAMVHEALQAFLQGDASKAKEVLKLDDQVDALNDQIFRELLTYMLTDAKSITRSLALILVARSLERIADHATNICEEVVYMVKGEDIRHQGHEETA
jgi:phosphate transport system protein